MSFASPQMTTTAYRFEHGRNCMDHSFYASKDHNLQKKVYKTMEHPSDFQQIAISLTDLYRNRLGNYSTVVCEVRRNCYLVSLCHS